MGLPMIEKMQVAILLVSIMNDESLRSTVAASKTVDGDKATTGNVCSRLLEKYCAQQVMKGCNTTTD